ncbi:glycosyltransferase family A protein [Spirillospora albida]|uniref:glycosyltransferase family A protein n=1 Tax=Spirillospora albida TaxID=58123 RepID=UPI0006910669|nr:glycosyltransferase family A protein [Spirillospora albida]
MPPLPGRTDETPPSSEGPLVTVIVPVFDCRNWIGRALGSVFGQSLPAASIEVIAVDDGSTDGSAAELDRLAAAHPNLTVVHQPNSGGPGGPRNVGLDRARGEYVFFLDADDHLAPRALERMCAMADEHGTDVVIGRYAGVGRRVPHFPRTVARTDVLAADPFVYGTLSPLKLFRRSLIERLSLRFEAGLASHEDQLFTARAYFGADGISVYADEDCYHWVDREDGTSVLQTGGARAETYFPAIERVMRFVADHTEPGAARDRLLARHFRYEVFSRLGHPYPEMSPAEKAATRAGAHTLLKTWFTPGVEAHFGARGRLLAHCVLHGLDDELERIVPFGLDGSQIPITVEGDRVHALYPGFREGRIPDDRYRLPRLPDLRSDLTAVSWHGGRLRIDAEAAIPGLAADAQTAELVLSRRDGDDEHRVPLPASIDFSSFASGHWDANVAVRAGALTVRRRLTSDRTIDLPACRLARIAGGRPVVTPYRAPRGDGLAIEVGGGRPAVTVTEADWIGRRTLSLHASFPSADPSGGTWTACAVLTRRGSGSTHTFPLAVSHGGDDLRVSGELDLRSLDAGRWDVAFEIGAGHGVVTVRAPAPARLPQSRVWGNVRIAPYRTVHGNLSLTLTHVTWGRRVRELLPPR